MIGPWAKFPHNPILTAGDYEWESKNVLNPTAIVKEGKVYLYYRAQNDKRVSCVWLFQKILSIGRKKEKYYLIGQWQVNQERLYLKRLTVNIICILEIQIYLSLLQKI